MHRKWEKLGICCRDNLGAFAVGRIFGRAGVGAGRGGGPQGRGGVAGRRPGGGAAEMGGARLPARRAGGLRPVCLRLLQRWRGGAKNSPVFLIPGMVESNNSIKQNRTVNCTSI